MPDGVSVPFLNRGLIEPDRESRFMAVSWIDEWQGLSRRAVVAPLVCGSLFAGKQTHKDDKVGELHK